MTQFRVPVDISMFADVKTEDGDEGQLPTVEEFNLGGKLIFLVNSMEKLMLPLEHDDLTKLTTSVERLRRECEYQCHYLKWVKFRESIFQGILKMIDDAQKHKERQEHKDHQEVKTIKPTVRHLQVCLQICLTMFSAVTSDNINPDAGPVRRKFYWTVNDNGDIITNESVLIRFWSFMLDDKDDETRVLVVPGSDVAIKLADKLKSKMSEYKELEHKELGNYKEYEGNAEYIFFSATKPRESQDAYITNIYNGGTFNICYDGKNTDTIYLNPWDAGKIYQSSQSSLGKQVTQLELLASDLGLDLAVEDEMMKWILCYALTFVVQDRTLEQWLDLCIKSNQ